MSSCCPNLSRFLWAWDLAVCSRHLPNVAEKIRLKLPSCSNRDWESWVVVKIEITDFWSCCHYGSEVSNLCRILNSKVYVYCDRVQSSKALGLRVLYQTLFRWLFLQLCSWYSYYEQKRISVRRTTICFRSRSKIRPIPGNELFLGFNFAISPRRVCCSRFQGDVQFFCPINEVGVNEGTASFLYKRRRDSKEMFPIFTSRFTSLRSCVRDRVYHQKTIKCIKNQEAKKITVTWWVKRSFVINMDCSERNGLVLPFFQWYFFPVFRLWFIVVAGEAINSDCTSPVKHARPAEHSFRIIVSFRSEPVSARFFCSGQV